MSSATGVTAETETRHEEHAGSTSVATQVVLCLGPWYENAAPEQLTPLLTMLREALGPLAPHTLLAYPSTDAHASAWQHEGMMLQPYQPSAQMPALTVQTAPTYFSLYEIMRSHAAPCGMLLGPEAHTMQPAAIRVLISAVLERTIDIALPRYEIGPNEALVNASILQPLSRAIYGIKARSPLALDLAMSDRMAERMASTALRFASTTQPDALVWPTAEAATAGYTVAEVEAGVRELPHPASADLSSILNTVASSLFLDIESKAAFWQRTRPAPQMLTIPAVPLSVPTSDPVEPAEISELVESFRIGYGNLHEIWALVLPPQTLLGLKHLSRLPAENFSMPDALWVRIVYDFVLAHRLRTINRGHLMGALTPLYLAWVASHILAVQNGSNGNADALARAFEADKPYLVSRWRWPDRFNP